MAVIYSDDFQSYSVGQTTPFVTGTGSMTSAGFFNCTIVNSPTGIFGKTKNVEIPSLTALVFADAAFTASTSAFFGLRLPDNNVGGQVYAVVSGSTTLATIQFNVDLTISIFGGITRAATSTLPYIHIGRWYWFQVNFTFAHVAGNVIMGASVTVDDQTLVSVSGFNTGVPSAGLGGIGPDHYGFGPRYNFAEFTLEDLVAPGTNPNPGTPKLRVTQGLGEVYVEPDSANIRLTQGIAEVYELPNTAAIRATQGIIELYIHTRGNSHVYEA